MDTHREADARSASSFLRAELLPAPATPVGTGVTPASPAPSLQTTLRSRGSGRAADRLFRALMFICALSLPLMGMVVLATLLSHAQPSINRFGWRFLFRDAWNPVGEDFGALAFFFGTIVSSLLALLMAAPGALAVAIFVVEICPRPLRAPIAFLTELLAAIPSVVYGLWALLVLAPLMREHLGPALVRVFGWTGWFRGPNFGVGVMTAGIILAIMIFPVISSVSREVMQAVPADQREAVLALGATRWESVRIGVLGNARLGLIGALILGLGRALGETMAVAMVIGSHPRIFHSLFSPGYTLGSVIANEFAESGSDLHLSALMELGLALFAVTAAVNALARLLVWLVRRDFLREAIA